MPKLDWALTNCAFYLYDTKEGAMKGEDSGGTGFLIGIPSEVAKDRVHLFAVTNWHVAIDVRASNIRLNKLDGTVDVIERQPKDWIPHPDRYDIAVTPIEVQGGVHKVGYVLSSAFVTDDIVHQRGIGPGEEIFMVGRFVDHDGITVNTPAVRFGHISIMPTPLPQAHDKLRDAYCLDVHSRQGFSGSPVFVFRTLGSNFTPDGFGKVNAGDTFLYLLGVHFGQFPELWDVLLPAQSQGSGLKLAPSYISGVSGMTMAAPAQRIMDIFTSGRGRKALDTAETLAKNESA